MGYSLQVCKGERTVLNVYRDRWTWEQPQLYNQAASGAPGHCTTDRQRRRGVLRAKAWREQG